MDITPSRKMIQQEETATQAAVSESTMSRVGAGINFINTRHYYNHDFNLNGFYAIVPVQNGIDGFLTYPFAFEILDVVLKTGDNPGLTGTTEVDLKWAPINSNVYQSIFSTTPKYTPAAGAHMTWKTGSTVVGTTAPVLNKTTFAAFDIIRLDLLQKIDNTVDSLYVKVFIRPINA